MTMCKIAVSLPSEQVEAARRAVAEGRAASVSAYVSAALAATTEKDGLELYVESLIRRFGEPSAEARAWAAQVLDDLEARRS